MLPGKKYTVDDALRILRQRLWLLIVPFAVVSAATALYARWLPNVYTAQSLIVVVPAQVPENLVKSTVNTRLDGRLQAISQQVMSRARLEKIVDDFDLYARERRNGALMEDIVAQMRHDTPIATVRSDAFTVTYSGEDPRTVQKVAQRIASLFIDENLRDRAALAEGTNSFLEVQLADAKRSLEEKEKALEVYRLKYAGQLPSQVQSNLQALQNVQMQVQSTLEARNRDRDQRLVLQRELANLQETGPIAPTPRAPTDPSATQSLDPTSGTVDLGSTARQLDAANAIVKSLELRYKPGEPDLDKAIRFRDELQQKLDAENLTRPVSADAPAQPVSPAERERLQRMSDLKAQMDQIDTRLTTSQNDEVQLRLQASDLQQRIDAVPTRESEMTELTRDYGVLQSTYASLLQKKEEAGIAANLEKQQIGEQFNIVDDAQIPERPTSPNRPAITYLGMVGGLAVGLLAVALLEYRATSFQTDDEVTRLLALPVLAVVPIMESEREHSQAIRFRRLRDIGLGTTVVACLAVLLYTLVR